ncbi:SDR family oxidoreductase [Nocardia sp. CA-129566]|uniref:SDR family oxidoreductase n=1 Tax=Nocardia sp. CA-129566 TaxID=3239976 RepID=UPI003D96BBB9
MPRRTVVSGMAAGSILMVHTIASPRTIEAVAARAASHRIASHRRRSGQRRAARYCRGTGDAVRRRHRRGAGPGPPGPILSLPGTLAQPEQIAKAAVFLASDAASFVNGAIVPVDSGWSAG